MTHTNPDARTSVVYDAIDAFQRTHRLPGLQHAQIRGLLAEHLARVLPSALAAPEPAAVVSSPSRDDLRDLIADVLRTTPRADYEAATAHRNHRYDARCALCAYETDTLADAVLAVLPVPVDEATVLRRAADVFDRDHMVSRMFGHQVAAELRRMAAEAQPTTETDEERADREETR